MRKNVNMGLIIVLSMSVASSAELISADTAYINNNQENKKMNIFPKDAEERLKNSVNTESDAEEIYDYIDDNTNIKVTPLSKSGKINSGKIITEKIYEKETDETVSSSAIGSGSVDFKLKFKSADSKDNFSLTNFTEVTNINTSGAAINFASSKIPYVSFDVSLGDIIIRKVNGIGVTISQNEKETFLYDGIRVMLIGSTSRYGVYIDENIDTEIILNGVSVSSDNGINIGESSNVDFKIIDGSLNTVRNFNNDGRINIYGETGLLTSRNFNGKVGIFGGVIKATDECEGLSEIIIRNCSADIKTKQTVKNSASKKEELFCNSIKLEGVNSSEMVEVDINGEPFISKTDISGKLYLFLPNSDNKIIIKNKNTAFIANVKENGGGSYTAKEISEINRVDVEVFQNLRNDDFVDVSFKVKIPDNMKYSDDLRIGVQCFDSGWLIDDSISEKNIAKLVKDENSDYYNVIVSKLENNKNYKCRVFSLLEDEANFSDVMEFKTKSVKEESFDEIKVSGFSKTFNSLGQGIDVFSDADYKVIYYQDGKRLEKLPVNAGKYTAKVIVNDKEHEYFEKNFEFIIEKAEPTVLEVPYATNVIAGNKISASKLFGGKAEGNGRVLDGSFKWKDEEEIIEKSGEYIAKFIPDDTNYLSIEYEVAIVTDEEKRVNFVYNLENKRDIKTSEILILKTEAMANDGSAVIYQWYKNGEIIDGAVSGIFVKDGVSENDSGEYFVVARSLDGYSAQSGKCFINVIEGLDDNNENESNKSDLIDSVGSVGNYKRKLSRSVFLPKKKENESESEIESTTDEFYENETDEADSDENKTQKSFIKSIFNRNNDNINNFDGEGEFSETVELTSEDDEPEGGFIKKLFNKNKDEDGSESSDFEDTISGLELIKRITDDLLIEIYGKVTYPDDYTVAATTVYNGPYTGQEKAVFQLNENGYFTEVDKYSFLGNEVSVLTDRDFPLIIGKAKTYSDIKYHWDNDDIKFISAFDIMSGQGNNFNPEKNVTRGDFIKALYNLAGKPEYSEKQEYFDVMPGSEYYDSVNWAYEQGFIKGRSETEFGVNLNVTREQAAVVISKYIEKMGFDLSGSQKMYSDFQNISDWALEDVYKVSKAGIMGDLGYGRFQPKAFCSRAEVATFIKKIIQYRIEF